MGLGRRSGLAGLLGLATLLALPTAAAQDDACSQQAPCSWVVDVDAAGVIDAPPGGWNFTAGDWFVLDVFNLDEDAAHRINVIGAGIDVTVAPVEGRTVGPFRFDDEGTYSLVDSPSGDDVPVNVWPLDVVEVGEGIDDGPSTADLAEGEARDTPAAGLPVAVPALALLALLARSRRVP
jgi:hypothetical protein